MSKIIAIALALGATFARLQADSAISLSINREASGQILLTWPTSPPNFRLEERASLSSESTWLPSALVPTEQNGRYQVLVHPTLSSQYFRLNQVLTDDVPDPEYFDTNGDGIDGDVAKAVFVAAPPLGNDANPGTMDRPVASIEKGVELGVRFSPTRDVYVSKGTYSSQATIRLASGVGLYGQYDAANGWQRAANNETTLRGPATAIQALFLNRETHLEGLHVVSAAAAAPGQSSYAIRAQNLTGKLVVRYNLIEAGAGAPSAAGANGVSGSPGGVGNNGHGGENGGDPGTGGTSPCGQPGGRGGLGGYDTPGLWGTPGAGWDGNPGRTPGAPGRGGAMGPPCDDSQPGFSGMDGRDGLSGRNGLETSNYGSIVEDEFRPGQGNPGTSGTKGGGGGGAGGGGANEYVLFGCGSYIGGGGGGGGGGGCAGTAGSGGNGGGGSFGLFLVNSAATVAQNRIITGNGGTGGNGGSGGLGGSGGTSGPNGEGWGYAAPGGNGGKGGNGGSGGSGSGGPGGPCVGIVLKASPDVTIDANTMFLGLPGAGGKGGTNSSLGNAPDGPNGVIRDIITL